VTAVELRPMTAAEYDAWLPTSIEEYAAEHARAGSRPADKSLEMAHEEFQKLLPEGLATPEHHLVVGLVEGTPVGFLWLRIPPAGEGSVDAFIYNVEVDADQRGHGARARAEDLADAALRDDGRGWRRSHYYFRRPISVRNPTQRLTSAA